MIFSFYFKITSKIYENKKFCTGNFQKFKQDDKKILKIKDIFRIHAKTLRVLRAFPRD
jgi:hypothetical protein